VRITDHPVLEFATGRRVHFTYEGREYEGYEGEVIAAALHAAGIRVLHYSARLGRPRGFFCAIGNCSSCLMTVDGRPNVRVCVERLRAGMDIRIQHGPGVLPPHSQDRGERQ
jgi:predicted molibdopterin-dependent oxidoreductase YjgC